MTILRTRALVSVTILMLTVLTLTAVPTAAAVETTAAGTIVANAITSATIDPATSIATIGGAIQCSATTQVTVSAWARQYRSARGPFAEYFGGVTVTCGPTPTSYRVTLTPGYESDRLVPGQASVGFWAEYCADRCYGLNTEREMRLAPAR